MKLLMAEDDIVSKKLLKNFLDNYGKCDVTIDGKECLEAYVKSMDKGEPYDLICLDIMMPKMNGVEVLEQIRLEEERRGVAGREMVKIIMTTALDEVDIVMKSFRKGCESYLIKPILKEKLEEEMIKLDLLKEQ